MSKYHAGKGRIPLCGAKGSGGRYNVIVLKPSEWKTLPKTQRCSKCVERLTKQ